MISEQKKFISAKLYPFFWVFRALGPIITSRTLVREVMMGPWARNTQKNGYNKAEIDFYFAQKLQYLAS